MNNDKQPKILDAAFALETVAHLRGLESELLPLASELRKIHENQTRATEEAWNRFIAHIEKTQPLGHYKKEKGKMVYVTQSHTHFLGSIAQHRKLFLDAQKVDSL